MLSTFIPPHFRPEVRGGRLRDTPWPCSERAVRRPVGLAPESIPALVFGPKSDAVVKLLESRLKAESKIQILYYEDIGSKWGYSYDGEAVEFFQRDQAWSPRLIYVRGTVVEPTHPLWREMGDLYELLNCVSNEVLGRPERQTPNESKLYQLSRSLGEATRKVKGAVNLGESFVLKGDLTHVERQLDALQSETSGLIVKSLSGVRSKVVAEDVYRSWSPASLNAVPALFQRRILGSDARVHVLKDRHWGLIVQDKTEVDYRYAPSHSEMKELELPEAVREFCSEVSRIEDNPLLGIDFIVDGNGEFTVLEANPGPGWAWYHEKELCRVSFLDAFLEVLESGTLSQVRP